MFFDIKENKDAFSHHSVIPAAFDSEHDENLGLTTTKEKKLKITNYPRFAITWDIQSKIH